MYPNRKNRAERRTAAAQGRLNGDAVPYLARTPKAARKPPQRYWYFLAAVLAVLSVIAWIWWAVHLGTWRGVKVVESLSIPALLTSATVLLDALLWLGRQKRLPSGMALQSRQRVTMRAESRARRRRGESPEAIRRRLARIEEASESGQVRIGADGEIIIENEQRKVAKKRS